MVSIQETQEFRHTQNAMQCLMRTLARGVDEQIKQLKVLEYCEMLMMMVMVMMSKIVDMQQ